MEEIASDHAQDEHPAAFEVPTLEEDVRPSPAKGTAALTPSDFQVAREEGKEGGKEGRE
jgi:hypothetical protein